MESTFKIWKTNRKLLIRYLDNYTISQLNTIPDGFSNNLIWNIGHVIVAQQALVYKGSGLNPHIPKELFDLYNPGTKPTENTSKNEIVQLRELLVSLIERTEIDYCNGKFITYNEKTTGTGFHLNSLKDAFEFNNYHEGLHLGLMMNIRKFI